MSIPLAPSTKTIFGWSPLSYHHLFCQHFPEPQIDVFLFLNMSINSWVDLSLIISLLFDVNPVVLLEVSLWFIIDANSRNLFKDTSTNFLGQFWHKYIRWRPTWPFVLLHPKVLPHYHECYFLHGCQPLLQWVSINCPPLANVMKLTAELRTQQQQTSGDQLDGHHHKVSNMLSAEWKSTDQTTALYIDNVIKDAFVYISENLYYQSW